MKLANGQVKDMVLNHSSPLLSATQNINLPYGDNYLQVHFFANLV